MKKLSLTNILVDWREVLTKIVVPNQFSGLLLYVDKLARVLATWVKNLPVVDLQNFIFNVQSATATFKGI